MSIPQTNFENNNRMSELTKNINDIFGYILLYSVIIFTTVSALLGGIVVYPIYGAIYIFNKIREHCCKSASEATNEVVQTKKKPIIDENWCNVSVKNIINFESEVEDISNAEDEVAVENEVQSEVEDISNAEDEVAVENEIATEAVVNLVEEEVLKIRRPSEEELRQFQKEEEEDISNAEDEAEDDYSPKDKYSIGHYKSKTQMKDPLDFVEY